MRSDSTTTYWLGDQPISAREYALLTLSPEVEFVLIGGRYDGQRGALVNPPARITVGGLPYVRMDDPRTGAYLGGYVHE